VYSTLFAELLIAHLQSCGVSFQDCRFQTDNGSEFIGAWNAAEDSAFTKAVQAVKGLVHQTIPPGAHTWQADVETVHGLIEDEFYCVERFHSPSHFLAKAAAYNLWFNVARKNSSKGHKTPWEIVKERQANIHPPVAAWQPVYLDELGKLKLDAEHKRGDEVIPQPSLGLIATGLLGSACQCRSPNLNPAGVKILKKVRGFCVIIAYIIRRQQLRRQKIILWCQSTSNHHETSSRQNHRIVYRVRHP
jgi:hypothetical protein